MPAHNPKSWGNAPTDPPARKPMATALKHGISEHSDSVNGQPLGVTFLGMSCTIATMILDGLTRRHAGVRLKQPGRWLARKDLP